MSQPEAPLAIGEELDGRYRILSKGAAAGLWQTYAAYDGRQDRLVVVLLLARQVGTDISLLERVARANQSVLTLSEPGIVPYDRAGLANGQFYLVRRHLEGQSLRHWLDHNQVDYQVAVRMILRLCEIVAPAHRAGLIHGGLSPHSIWIGAEDQDTLSIVDFGLVQALGGVGGPLPYQAPEQATGQDVHPSADVYAIGLLLYEMLVGHVPFSAELPGATTGAAGLGPAENWLPQVPRSLAEIVRTALVPEPSARYRNAGQLAHLLRGQLEPQRAGVQAAEPPASGLVVPAPAGRVRPPASEPVYYPDFEQEQWSPAPAGVDWLLVALLVAALVAVLGLIPLWRVVRQRYAPAPVLPAPAVLMVPLSLYARDDGSAALTTAASGLEIFRLIWYNLAVEAERERELAKCCCLRTHLDGGGNAVPVGLPFRQPPG